MFENSMKQEILYNTSLLFLIWDFRELQSYVVEYES